MPEAPLSHFTAADAATLEGPAWLRERRSAAAHRFEAAGLPSSEAEVWRYSRIDELDLSHFTLAPPPAAGHWPADALPLAAVAAHVMMVDGRVVSVETSAAPAGLQVRSLADITTAHEAHDLLGPDGAGPDAFADMNAAFGADVIVISVRRGVAVEQPVVVTQHLTADGVAVFPRVIVRAADGSQLTIVERSTSADVHGLVVPVVEAHVGQGAHVSYVAVQELGTRVWQIADHVYRVGREATFLGASVALGGDYARLRTDCRLDGRGASGDLLSAYFGEGSQHLDFRTFQDHRAPDTTSNLLFKGAVGGHSRSVYTGLIKVRKEAKGTNAFQTNRNIKLSDHAWAESVPNLEIENNDVRCSHASTVGPIDDEQRFYLESRGVPPRVAERLVVAGFFDEVIARLPVPDLANPLRARIAAKIDRAAEDDR